MRPANRVIYLTLFALLATEMSAGAAGEATRSPFSSECLYRTPLVEDNNDQGGVHETLGAGRLFGIFINTTLYGQIAESVGAYMGDLESDGWHVVVYAAEGGTSQKSERGQWTSEDFVSELEAARQLRDLLRNEYQQGMVGCILVGELPAGWVEAEAGSGTGNPVDLFFRDMDSQWDDTDGNGLLDNNLPVQGDCKPEIWMSRLYASSLTGDEVSLMDNYFRKNHAYRIGELTLPRRALDYVDDDWACAGFNVRGVYDDITQVNDNQITIASDYKKRLADGYELIRVSVHGYGPGHGFYDTPDFATAYAHCYVHSPVAQDVQLRLGADDSIKAWLNGATTSEFCGGSIDDEAILEEDPVNASLHKGWNRLLLEISDRCRHWRFSARFSDTQGHDIKNLSYQLNDPEVHGREAPFIKSWLINGFYHDPDTPWWHRLESEHIGEEDAIDPTEGQFDGLYAWTRVEVDQPYVNLDAAFAAQQGLEFGVGYAFVRVYSDCDQTAQLWLGCDFGMMAWLNGENVFTYNDSAMGWSADEHKVNVTVRKGHNRLLLKISKWCGNCGFGSSARFAHTDGTTVTGLEYDPAPAPVRYIKNWLINGWYKNPDKDTCPSAIDCLGGETSVTPSEGETNGTFVWQTHYSLTDDINLNNVFAESGNRVEYTDVLAIDPCCLFYDSFSCGTFHWWNTDYIDGWLVFTPSYGLASWGECWPGKAGIFYDALSEAKCLGEAQLTYLSRLITDKSYLGGDFGDFGMFGDPTLAPGLPRKWSIMYVDAAACGDNSGTSWKDAYNYLQDALAAATWGTEIHVARGTYRPDEGAVVNPNDRTATFQLRSSVVIRGGYAGLGESDPNTRNVRLYETILSGDIGIPNDNSDNTYHVVTASGMMAPAVLDGFTIAAGNADGSEPDNCGAGLYIDTGSPAIANCTIQENAAGNEGGGLFSYNASPTLSNCTFGNNSAPNHRGGGMSIIYGRPSLSACTFNGNRATWAGGLYCTGSKPTLVNCLFTANQATYGGAMRCHFSDAALTNCTLSNNQAPTGGAMYNTGAQPMLVNCIVWANTPEQIAGDAIVSFSDVQGGWLGPGVDNINVDPCFVNAGNWDDNGTPDDTGDDFWIGGDHHLRSQAGRWDAVNETWEKDELDSPCIDAGDPNTPIGDEPEPNGGVINMGAYGGTAEASKSF